MVLYCTCTIYMPMFECLVFLFVNPDLLIIPMNYAVFPNSILLFTNKAMFTNYPILSKMQFDWYVGFLGLCTCIFISHKISQNHS